MDSIIQIILIIIILVTSLPVGYLLAYLTRDEILPLRKWFRATSILCIAVSIGVFIALSDLTIKLAVSLSLVYFAIVSLVCLIKSYDKKFVIKAI